MAIMSASDMVPRSIEEQEDPRFTSSGTFDGENTMGEEFTDNTSDVGTDDFNNTDESNSGGDVSATAESESTFDGSEESYTSDEYSANDGVAVEAGNGEGSNDDDAEDVGHYITYFCNVCGNDIVTVYDENLDEDMRLPIVCTDCVATLNTENKVSTQSAAATALIEAMKASETDKLNAMQRELEAVRAEMVQKEQEHESAIQQLQAKYSCEIQSNKEEYADEIDKLKKSHASAVARITFDTAEKLDNAQSSFNAAIDIAISYLNSIKSV